jgi:hypothetical protein
MCHVDNISGIYDLWSSYNIHTYIIIIYYNYIL